MFFNPNLYTEDNWNTSVKEHKTIVARALLVGSLVGISTGFASFTISLFKFKDLRRIKYPLRTFILSFSFSATGIYASQVLHKIFKRNQKESCPLCLFDSFAVGGLLGLIFSAPISTGILISGLDYTLRKSLLIDNPKKEETISAINNS